MFTPIKRIILIIINLTLSIYSYFKGDFIYMFFLLIASGLLIYGYIKYETVFIAFQQIKKGNIKKAEELISKISNPYKLTKTHKSYYYLANGIIALEKQDLEKAKSDLIQSLNIGLRTENDKSIALLNLANIELLKKNYNEASEYIKKVRKLKLKQSIESATNRIEKEINGAQHYI